MTDTTTPIAAGFLKPRVKGDESSMDLATKAEGASAAFGELMEERWSCRAFRPERVPREVLERVLSLAQRTPSWCNTQPWHVTLTSNPDTTNRFRRELMRHVTAPMTVAEPDIEMPPGYQGVHAERRRACGFQLYDSLGIERHDRVRRREQTLRNFAFFDAPHVAIISVDRSLGSYALLDTGIYVGNLLLAAHSLGLGVIPQAAIARHSTFVREHLGLPDEEAVVLGISLGWPDMDNPVNKFRTDRVAVDDVARFR